MSSKTGRGMVAKLLFCSLLVLSMVIGNYLFATSAMAKDKILIGIASSKSGWAEAYDMPAVNAAMIKIEEINKEGGLLGKKLQTLFIDTKSSREESAKAGAKLVDAGVDMMIVNCDYNQGAPAAFAAQKAGIISFFSCAEDVKAGIEGVGKYAFSGSILAATQGATMAEWSYKKRGARKVYLLIDTSIDYSKSVGYGFEWMFNKLQGTEIVKDTFKNGDPSIASQVTKIRNMSKDLDAIMICSYNPGASSAIKQIRGGGIDTMIMNPSSMDGNYWIAATDLKNVFLPVQGSIHGDDPNPKVEQFNIDFEKSYGHRPTSCYAYPGYILVDLWSKAVKKAGTTESDAVLEELEKFRNEETIFGPRTYTSELHHQNQVRLLIMEIADSKFKRVDQWTISEPVPKNVLFGK
jgi:branched-chain amino acid transport system substrate-binding protein